MAKHNEVGKSGELIAAEWLEKRGFTIRERNWKMGHLEIDLIATKGEWLHFIEVKTRSSRQWGDPENSVTPQKFNRWRKAAQGYLWQQRKYKWIQFDIIAITLETSDKFQLELFEDIYL
ncbi:MAG: YraN family protein [Chitinophagaceae bacterium]|jgi:putative endonuclease